MLNSSEHFKSKMETSCIAAFQLLIPRVLSSKNLFVLLNLAYQCLSGLIHLRIRSRDVCEVSEAMLRNKSKNCLSDSVPVPQHRSLPAEQCGWQLVPVQAL